MSKRMALIPEELLSSYQHQKPEVRIEDEMIRLLDSDKTMPDDFKVKLLSQLITRYHKVLNQPPEPIPVKIQETNEPMQPEKKYDDPPVDKMLRHILTSVPKHSAKYVPHIIEKLKTRGISWNENGEMTQDQKTLKNTNVIDFFSYLMRNSKEQLEPKYFTPFLKAIKEVKIPVSWILNKRLYKRLNEADDSFELETAVQTPVRAEERLFSPTKRRKQSRSFNLSFQSESSPTPRWRSRSQEPNQKWLNY